MFRWYEMGNVISWYEGYEIGFRGRVVGVDDFWIKKEGVRYLKVEILGFVGSWVGKFQVGFERLVRFEKGMWLWVLVNGDWKKVS
jgi:hypothetical protein